MLTTITQLAQLEPYCNRAVRININFPCRYEHPHQKAGTFALLEFDTERSYILKLFLEESMVIYERDNQLQLPFDIDYAKPSEISLLILAVTQGGCMLENEGTVATLTKLNQCLTNSKLNPPPGTPYLEKDEAGEVWETIELNPPTTTATPAIAPPAASGNPSPKSPLWRKFF